MATVEDYTSGKVYDMISLAFVVLESAEEPLKGTRTGESLLNAINISEPVKMSLEQTVRLIEESNQCAIGERICKCVHKDTPLTESVFLDELAAGMVAAKKARFVKKEEAIENMKKYRKHPIMVSKVSGKHSEICPAWAKKCIYWNMEKHQLKCVHRSV